MATDEARPRSAFGLPPPGAEPQGTAIPVAFSLALVVAIGLVDYLTGWEISFSIFYFLPVSVASWYGSQRIGMLVAVICAVAWFLADAATHPPYSNPSIPIWNAAARLGFFAIATLHVALLRRSMRREHDLARTDPLTGIANSRAFYEAVRNELSRCRRYDRPASLVYLDVDDFKSVNDSVGHLGGDDLLVRLARVLVEHTRNTDVVARLGGDEFAILLPETRADQAEAAVRNIRRALEHPGGPNITLSIGVVTCEAAPANPDDLVRQADELMYRAKAAGKDAVRTAVIRAESGPEPVVALRGEGERSRGRGA